MTTLDAFGIGAISAIALCFYFARRIPVYLALCAGIVLAFAVATWASLDRALTGEWSVLVFGLALGAFGLLIVRVMLVRSVSLQLLGDIAQARPSGSSERLGGRLADMRAFHLIRTTGEVSELTAFGRLISAIVAAFYSVFGVTP